MKLTINVEGRAPEIAARLIAEQAEDRIAAVRAELRKRKLVYVRAHVRTGPLVWFRRGKTWTYGSREFAFIRWQSARERLVRFREGKP